MSELHRVDQELALPPLPPLDGDLLTKLPIHEDRSAIKPIPTAAENTTLRPMLEPPSRELFTEKSGKKVTSLVDGLKRFLDHTENIEAIYLQAMERHIDSVQETYADNLAKRKENELDIAKEINDSDWWDFLRKVAVCLVSATSIVIGGTLLAGAASTGAILAGGSMVISGIASILGNTLYDTKTHPQLATALTLVGSGFGLVGGVTGIMSGVGTLNDMIGRAVVAAISVGANTTNIMKEMHAQNLDEYKGKDIILQTDLKDQGQQLKLTYQDIEHFQERLQSLYQHTTQNMNRWRDSIDRVVAYSGPLSEA